MPFFDAHTHIQFAIYDGDREKTVRRADAMGIRMVTVGTQRDTSRLAVEAAEKYPGIYAAIGLHPIHTGRAYHDVQELGGGEAAKAFVSRGEIFDPAVYRPLAAHPKTVAIGECGLDYFRFDERESREEQVKKQKAAFSAQIAFAREVRKPLMIHCRAAFPDLIAMLRSEGRDLRPGVIHFFTGTLEDAELLLDMGFSFTFGGVVTFARDYDGIIRYIPRDRIMSETDAPYVAPAPYRGKRNEPSYVVETVKKLAELKGVTAEEMAESIGENARRIFGI